jgi:hypothetical protein
LPGGAAVTGQRPEAPAEGACRNAAWDIRRDRPASISVESVDTARRSREGTGSVEILLREAPALLGRALIPLMPGPNRAVGGTAFLYNHLLNRGSGDEPDTYATFLITARGMTTGEYGFLGIPRHMVSDPRAAEHLVFQGWSHAWQHPADARFALAALPYHHLAAHAERKGWTWCTDEVTDGMLHSGDHLAVRRGELAAYGYEADGVDVIARQQPVLRAVDIVRTGDGTPGISGAPASFVGAPIVALTPRADGRLGFFVVGMVGEGQLTAGTAQAGPLRPLVSAAAIRSGGDEIYGRLAATAG